jgi:hypothetical protein
VTLIVVISEGGAQQPKFPAAGNLSGNFSTPGRNFYEFFPKLADFALWAGNGTGNPGNFSACD